MGRGGGDFYTGEIKNLAFFHTREFQNCFENFKGNFAIFKKNLENCGNLDL